VLELYLGKVRSIGASNFSEVKLEEILQTAEIVPAVNQANMFFPNNICVLMCPLLQLELHVYNPQLELLSYLNAKGITPQAYSPLGSSNSPLLTDDVVVQIATKHLLQPSDILLGYLRMFISAVTYRDNNRVHLILVAKGIVVLPKSVRPVRITSNFTGALAAANKLRFDVADLRTLDGLAASGKQKR
jgi:glycerol 2-dehydrogenase (NADP+)